MGEASALLVIFLAAVVTYATRIGGWLVLSRFGRLHPRVEAALEAVPAAVMTTLVAPPALTNGPAEFAAILATIAASYRLNVIGAIGVGMAVLVAARALGV